jgi:hypothetical protein
MPTPTLDAAHLLRAIASIGEHSAQTLLNGAFEDTSYLAFCTKPGSGEIRSLALAMANGAMLVNEANEASAALYKANEAIGEAILHEIAVLKATVAANRRKA